MPAEAWRFEDFELNPADYQLRCRGQPVRLERIPFELLCFLVERRGELVTREEIIERVWGKGVFIDSENSINTAVRKIRRALNDDAESPRFIVTVPARGYRFVATLRDVELAPAKQPVEAAPAAVGMPEQASRRYWPKSALSIAGLAFLAVAAVVIVHHLALRPSVTTASIPRAEKPTPPSLPLPDKPSIAVLPFANMSGDPQQEYFSDGITDELITALSRLPDLFVIARTSTFAYKGKAVKVQDVSRELGARYVLDGSIRKSGDTVRVTAQLVDASTGNHLWAQHYDRPMRNIFALQDEIVRRIVTTLNLQLSLWDKYGLLVTKRTDNLEAYDDFLRGLAYCNSKSRAGNVQAREMYEKAIKLDPNYSEAFASLAYTYLLDWAWRWSQEDHNLDRAFEIAQHAVALDDSQSLAHALLGATYLFKRQHEQALAEGQQAIDLAPNFAPAYSWMAETLTFSGRPAEAIGLVEKAMRLDPRNQDFYLYEIARAYNRMGRFAEAVPVLKRHLARYPNSLPGHASLAIAYAELGREVEARAEGAEVSRISPNFSIGYEKMNPDIDRAWVERRLADLRKAGLK